MKAIPLWYGRDFCQTVRHFIPVPYRIGRGRTFGIAGENAVIQDFSRFPGWHGFCAKTRQEQLTAIIPRKGG